MAVFSKQQVGQILRERCKKVGAPGGSRTPDLQVRSLPLYPAELRARINRYRSSSLISEDGASDVDDVFSDPFVSSGESPLRHVSALAKPIT